ncbi:copper resistance protein CopC [Cryptosporangium sp. NPDC048952]|uniref:copper resistance CopC family protein n=1 Tax=Cryptosporangium sp. NPDC048952 TaxID=3363961 RepID=UPI00371E34B9
MRSFIRRALGAAFLLVVVASSPAQAHSDILGSSPAADSTITTAPDEITLTFAAGIRGDFSTVVVTGPGGARYGDGKPRAVDRVLHQPVKPLTSGRYTVAWRIVSADGHPLQGVFTFTAALPSAQASSASAAIAPGSTLNASPGSTAGASPGSTARSAGGAAPSPGPTRAAAASTSGDDDGNGLFLASAAAGVLVIVVGLVALTRRRRSSPA